MIASLLPQLPSNNMGAQSTSPRKNASMGCLITKEVQIPLENRCLIDWLAWTIKTDNPHEAIKLSGFSCLSFTQSKSGGMGYKSSLRSGNIVVYYDGAENMGCHISMTGQGCRQFEAAKGVNHSWYQLFHALKSVNANITRLDLAVDTVDGSFCLDKLEHACRTKTVRSLFKGGSIIQKLSFTDKVDNGRTIYIGSPSSRLKIRFYDKAAQLDLNTHWVRCELQLMAERAQEAVKHLLASVELGQLAVSALNQYFAVINLDDSNKSRCSLQDWWAAWLTTTDKLKLTTMKAIKLVNEIMEHVKRQYSATFAMIKKHLGVVDMHEYVKDLIETGKDRMNKKHELILACSALECEPAYDLPF